MRTIELFLSHIVTAEMWISMVALAGIIGVVVVATRKDQPVEMNEELGRASRQKKGGYVWNDKLDQMWRRSDEISTAALDAISQDGLPEGLRKQLRRIIELERTQTNDIVTLRNMKDD